VWLLLADARVQPNLRDKHGMTALDLALSRRYGRVILVPYHAIAPQKL
jgi:hypothetical protein